MRHSIKRLLFGIFLSVFLTGHLPVYALSTHGMTLPDTGDFLIYWSPERLAAARAWHQANPNWTPRATGQLQAIDQAFLYVLTGNNSTETQNAINYLMSLDFAVDNSSQLGSDNARWYGEEVALMYNWLKPLLTPTQKQTLLTRWNRFFRICLEKPWGAPHMPDSNYYWGFTRNAFLWALATYNDSFTDPNTNQTQRQVAEDFLNEALVTRWEATQLPYLNTLSKGGAYPEGSHYGPYLIDYYAIMMAVGEQFGRPLFNETNYFKEVAFNVLYATTPKRTYGKRISTPRYQVFTYGDVQDVDGSPPADAPEYGNAITLYATHWDSLLLSGFLRTWLNTVNPLAVTTPSSSMTKRYIVSIDPGFSDTGTPYSQLPTDYFSPGSSFFYTRNTWASGANDKPMVVYMQGQVTGSHAHRDAGTFQILRNDRWLSEQASGRAITYTGYDGSGSISSEQPGTSNTILFNYTGPIGDYSNQGTLPGATRLESRPEYAFMALNLTPGFQATNPRYTNPYAGSVVREFIHLKSLDTLIVFDRLRAVAANGLTAADVPKTFLFHMPFDPTVNGNIYTSVYGTEEVRAMSLTSAVSGQTNTTYRVVDESTNMTGTGGTIDPQFRLQVNTQGSADSYHIHVIQTKSTGDSNIIATLSETSSAFQITLTRSGQPNTVVTFEKGMSSSGGSVALGSQFFNLNAGMQTFAVTDNGPEWGPLGETPPPPSRCNLNTDSLTNVVDVQLCANQAIQTVPCTNGDINQDGQCNVVDVQRVVNAALGGSCVAQ